MFKVKNLVLQYYHSNIVKSCCLNSDKMGRELLLDELGIRQKGIKGNGQ